jgi:NDP-sugar pyrophosphorylase family protein
MHDIFTYNAKLIQYDFELLTNGRKSAGINDKFSAIYGADNIFVEEGVKVRAAIINAENGLVYIGKNVDIQEGAMIHGTHAFCDNSVVNMGAKMRGDSTVGPYSKVGGEVGNSVIMGYSNKGHDGYMGNSVLGYWCNLGADTNTSNLKNQVANKEFKIHFFIQKQQKRVIQKESTAEMPIQITAVD